MSAGDALRRVVPPGARDGLRAVRRRMPASLVRRVDVLTGAVPAAPTREELAQAARRPGPPTQDTRVWIAPANFAGQGWRWARAIDAHLPGVGARSMAVTGPIAFPADQLVAPAAYRDLGWQQEQEAYLRWYTHVLVEAERPVLGTLYGRTADAERARLLDLGLGLGYLSHGSDLRVPSRHVERFEHSPFRDASDPTTVRLQRNAERNAAFLAEVDAPVFVSTPDLLDDCPRAVWCPTVVDVGAWASEVPVMERPVPRVVHIPSNGPLKGSEHADRVLRPLAEAGHIDYRRLSGVTAERILAEYREADIVLDQLVMGLYGVAALEGLAAGRVVLGFLGDRVRERVHAATGRAAPILEVTPETLHDVVTALLDDRDGAREAASAGPGFVRAVHDGTHSARVLDALTVTGPA